MMRGKCGKIGEEMLSIEEIRSAVQKAGKKYGIKSAYLFGSYARGEATEGSDIDIIIEKGRLQTYHDYSGFRFDLIDELGTDVDVLTTEGIKPRFYNLIKDDRVLLYGA